MWYVCTVDFCDGCMQIHFAFWYCSHMMIVRRDDIDNNINDENIRFQELKIDKVVKPELFSMYLVYCIFLLGT